MTEDQDTPLWTPASAGTVLFVTLGCVFGTIVLGLLLGYMLALAW